MSALTYYAALPFARTANGNLVPGKAKEFASAFAAKQAAESLAQLHAGAIAFSRSGDLQAGEFADAEVLSAHGDVLTIDDLIAAANRNSIL